MGDSKMVNPRDLRGFGDETENYTFKDTLDWFVHVRDPAEVFKAQPTYFLSEWSYVIIAFLSLIHAFIVGGRWKYHWLACYLHGWTTEMVSFWMPDIDNYWHSQTTIMFLGRRLPLHIPLIYPSLMYNAAYMVAHAKLPRWAEPMAAGLVEVLIDIPYDIMAVKFVHWTWHDTDPNIYDRHYWVPWNSYYFHLAFGTAFTFALNFWRRKITGSDDKGEVSSPGKEIVCAFLAGLCGMPGGVIQFIFLYHPLHDTYGIHTENCTLAIVLVYFLIVWAADRTPRVTSRRQKGEKSHWSVIIIVLNMVIHYGLYLSMAVFGKPEEEVSIGLHERTGPCDEKTDVYTAFGGVLKRQTYLCTDDYDEKYYDFHCLPGGQRVSDGMEWYTICGTPFPNRAEYISVIVLVCVVSAVIFYNLLFRSSRTLLYQKKKETKLKFN
ncbi:uncharacterized protein LOC121854768 isoform X1 [Homarus americanus]|uniref:uncharacterized protein LOC121854768 isoform X1 n=2 Tax=Homarus americanus TaxID=6706 RepID=UPI001C483BEB|nr:uncharacterized protein LOC121854768 isoform X1 [Homarus americanus]